MTDKLGLTFGNLIAHFLPGSIIFISIFHYLVDIKITEMILKSYPSFSLFLLAVLSLICGLILDSLRYLITLLPKISAKFREWSSIDISNSDDDDRKYHDWVIENHFRYHQFYGNLGLSFLFAAIILHLKYSFIDFVLFYIISLICTISSISTYRTTIKYLRKRFN